MNSYSPLLAIAPFDLLPIVNYLYKTYTVLSVETYYQSADIDDMDLFDGKPANDELFLICSLECYPNENTFSTQTSNFSRIEVYNDLNDRASCHANGTYFTDGVDNEYTVFPVTIKNFLMHEIRILGAYVGGYAKAIGYKISIQL